MVRSLQIPGEEVYSGQHTNGSGKRPPHRTENIDKMELQVMKQQSVPYRK
ncbi:MAG: hypothetical protein ACYSTG_03725 [Planctomycetota bacterium]